MDSRGSGSGTALLTCGQWMLKQRPLPNIVSNSWGGNQGGATWFRGVINSWRQVGIIPVFSIGNSGSQYYTAMSPGDQDNVISVGATTNSDSVTAFSSRGPAISSGKTKPAPGYNIVSAGAFGPSYYEILNGTSMAAPPVAGAIALMLQVNPTLTFSDVLTRLSYFADRPNPTIPELKCERRNKQSPYPNNAYGYGRINTRKAIE